MTPKFSQCIAPIAILLSVCSAPAFSVGGNPPAHAAAASAFAATAAPNAQHAKPGAQPAGAAAVVDGHVIPLDDVVALLLRNGGQTATELLIQSYVVDRECKRRGITVSQAEIDESVASLCNGIAPATLDDALKAHRETMAMLTHDLKQDIEREKLVIDQVKPVKMVHCRVIFIKIKDPRDPAGSKSHTEDEALAVIHDIQSQLKAGKEFGDLAKQYSEDDSSNSKSGDIGIVFEGVNALDTGVLNAALAMNKGEITPQPVRGYQGYYLIQAVSTIDNHSQDDDALYKVAEHDYKKQQAQYLIGQNLANLINKSKIVYYIH